VLGRTGEKDVLRQVLVVLALLAGIGAEPGSSAAAVTGNFVIPQGFLLTEAAARAPQDEISRDEEWWSITEGIGQDLSVDSCGGWSYADGRTSMRTISSTSSAPSWSTEQLVLYESMRTARAALAGVRIASSHCPEAGEKPRHTFEPFAAGEEAVLVTGPADGEHPPLAVVVREGKALLIYTSDHGFDRPMSQAREMAEKVCTIPGICY
jgi:hypothetical protein